MLSASQGEKPQKKSTQSTSWCQTPGLQNGEKIVSCGFRHLVCGTVLRQSQQTNTLFENKFTLLGTGKTLKSGRPDFTFATLLRSMLAFYSLSEKVPLNLGLSWVLLATE